MNIGRLNFQIIIGVYLSVSYNVLFVCHFEHDNNNNRSINFCRYFASYCIVLSGFQIYERDRVTRKLIFPLKFTGFEDTNIYDNFFLFIGYICRHLICNFCTSFTFPDLKYFIKLLSLFMLYIFMF